MKRACLFLDDKSILFLDEFKFEVKKSKSEIIRKMIHFFVENKPVLMKVLFDDS